MHHRTACLHRGNREALGAGNGLARAGDGEVRRNRARRIDDGSRIGRDAGPDLDQRLRHLPAAQQPGGRTIGGEDRRSWRETITGHRRQLDPASREFDQGGSVLGQSKHHRIARHESHDPRRRPDPQGLGGQIAIRNIVVEQAFKLGPRCNGRQAHPPSQHELIRWMSVTGQPCRLPNKDSPAKLRSSGRADVQHAREQDPRHFSGHPAPEAGAAIHAP